TSPRYKSMEVKGSMVELTFDVNPGTGMTSFGKEIKGFLVAGSNKRFYAGVAAITKNKVLVFSPNVETPIAVRYAFDDTSSSEIFNLNGMPISSFRTDDWEVKK
ncbi:MAG: sialate O-acetylesterase, partial [Paludibacter sp.]